MLSMLQEGTPTREPTGDANSWPFETNGQYDPVIQCDSQKYHRRPTDEHKSIICNIKYDFMSC